jgi:hypothetical protein
MKTKSKAIQHAKNIVSKLYKFGNGWKYSIYDDSMNMWRETHAGEYYAMMNKRAYALIWEARNFLYGEDEACVPDYNGGDWKQYI